MPASALKGVLAPVVTPFDAGGKPDTGRWLAHCRWLLSRDCGLAIFGTNSEANSLTLGERRALLDAAFAAGLDVDRMMPGTGACALPDAVELTKAAVAGGAAGVLMLPPFYYKDVSDDGLFAFYDSVIEQVADRRLRIYLYHIPPISQVAISLPLIERLLKAHPTIVAGVKDSGGDWANTRAMIDAFDNFDVFAGSEVFLLQTLRAGGVGCISAAANVNAPAINDLYRNWQAADADQRQARVTAFRKAMGAFPMIPALKATIALTTDDDGWAKVRPPLMALDAAQKAALATTLRDFNFAMPGRTEAA